MILECGDLIASCAVVVRGCVKAWLQEFCPPFDSCGVLGPFAGDVVGRPGLVKTSALLYVGGLE